MHISKIRCRYEYPHSSVTRSLRMRWQIPGPVMPHSKETIRKRSSGVIGVLKIKSVDTGPVTQDEYMVCHFTLAWLYLENETFSVESISENTKHTSLYGITPGRLGCSVKMMD